MGSYFPLFVDLSDKKIYVIGAGQIASRRLKSLEMFAKDITVIAPEASEAVLCMAQERRLRLILRTYERGEIPEDTFLVLAATDSVSVNQTVYEECKEKGIPVNVCSRKELCDFYFPGIAVKGQVTAGITSGGLDPALTGKAVEIVQKALESIE